jgi:hypothetical protein
MLTPWTARRISLTLGWITEGNYPDWDFGGRQLFVVRDFLQLLSVVQNTAIAVSRRMTLMVIYCMHIHQFILRESRGCENAQCSNVFNPSVDPEID